MESGPYVVAKAMIFESREGDKFILAVFVTFPVVITEIGTMYARAG